MRSSSSLSEDPHDAVLLSAAHLGALADVSADTAAPTATLAAEPSAPATAGVGQRTFASLRHRDFALLWTSTACMSGGQWLQQVTLSWLIFDLTGSAFLVGLINGLRMLPFLFTSLVSGAMADRLDRRLLMLGTQFYLMVITFLMAVLLLSGQAETWHLFVFSFASGIGWSFAMPVRGAVLPTLVPKEELMNAIALSSAAFNFTRVLGPALGGVLLATVGGGGNFMVQAVLYSAVVFLVAIMRIPPREGGDTSGAGNTLDSIKEGLRYVRANEIVLTLLILALVPMFLAMPFQSLLPVFAGEVYDIGPAGLGLLMSFAGLGSLLATLVVATLGDFRRKGLVQLTALGAMGVALALFGQAPGLPLALLFLILVGVFQMGYMTINQTLLQSSITDDMRGRVMSIWMLDFGLVPAGTLAAGGVAELIGAPTTVTIMGAMVTGIAVVAALRFKHLRNA